jgi:copper transport protein
VLLKRSGLAIAVVLAALTAAPSAFAHAILQESTPSNNSVVRTSPQTVSLRFNEAVETAFGSIRVYDCGGGRVDSGKIVRPSNDSVAVKVDRRLAQGTYTVTWRVISADSHPVAGAFVFNVKKATPGGSCKQVFGATTPGTIDALFKFMRALDFALILLVVGGAMALALVLRSTAPELRSRLFRILAGLSFGLVIAAALCIVLQGAVAGGFGLGEAFRWDTVHSVLETRFGRAFLWQIGLAVVVGAVALLASRSRRLDLLPLLALLLLPTITAAGHARTSGSWALLFDVIHIAAASTWVGGLAFSVLALLLAGEDRWPLASRAVPRFSILAVLSVVTLITAGTLRGYQEVRAFHGLWDTTYGQLLLAKIALVLPLLALGAYNNRFAVPRLKKQIASVVEQRRFLRAAGTELAIMAAIVGVTAVLVTEPPAKASVKAPKYATDTVPIGPLEMNYIVEPAKTGPNTIHLYFYMPKSGFPANVDDAKLSATLPSRGIGPLRIPLTRIVPSHYTTPAGVFPEPGDWQVTAEIRRGQFQSFTQTVTVPIREG